MIARRPYYFPSKHVSSLPFKREETGLKNETTKEENEKKGEEKKKGGEEREREALTTVEGQARDYERLVRRLLVN